MGFGRCDRFRQGVPGLLSVTNPNSVAHANFDPVTHCDAVANPVTRSDAVANPVGVTHPVAKSDSERDPDAD